MLGDYDESRIKKPGRATARWWAVRAWCQLNPGKKAALVTPQGTFVVEFKPKQAGALAGEDVSNRSRDERSD